ncbi:hypothetical protein M3C58_01590 [Brachybacterium muris]|uniref:hypothetical protein n=1 Tax=Brachybacterium muris TaxID=219301 RepID=UPI0021A2701F|nr:hypothetical protein [Brachybacterium muris]MCT1996906.1 hypothetical protein [Brachybacterium muris]
MPKAPVAQAAATALDSFGAARQGALVATIPMMVRGTPVTVFAVSIAPASPVASVHAFP